MNEHQSIPLRMWHAGYMHMVSVIPPLAPLSPRSKVQPGQRGKTPGRKLSNGTWAGYNWLEYQPSEEDIKQWAQDGANIGLLAEGYPAVDIDSLDEAIANECERMAKESLGNAPVRVGKYPKRLLVYTTSEPFSRVACHIIENAGTEHERRHLIEVLGKGRQYVIYGSHPSGVRYSWDTPLEELPAGKLTRIDREAVMGYFGLLKIHFEAKGYDVELVGNALLTDRARRKQSELEAPDLNALRACVDTLPNSDEIYPSREDYIQIGIAIKAAAGPDHEEEGYDIFASWAGRHEGGDRVEGNPETWRSDWKRMHAPFSVGWDWLAEQGRRFDFNPAEYEFEPDLDPVEPAPPGPPRFSEQWMAEQVYDDCGDRLRYVQEAKRWYIWDGVRWRPDATQLALHLIGQSLLKAAQQVEREGATAREKAASYNIAKNLCSQKAVAQVAKLLSADPRIAASMSSFDADCWLLNTPGGVIDLQTGSMMEPHPDAMCSKVTSVAPDFNMPAPRWQKFLLEATNNNLDLVRYMQAFAGYCLTGVTIEQVFGFIWGDGNNGKTKFTEAITGAMGDYHTVAPMDSFTKSYGDRHPTDLASMIGSRLVTASEVAQGKKWDEQRVKTLTGGERVPARFMFSDFIWFQPTFKLLFIGNDMPEIQNIDVAMRRRIHLIPFTHRPPVIDKDLGKKLKEEWPAILAWMIRGCLMWQKEGLRPPTIVQEATEDYFEDEDPLQQWIEDRCEIVADARTPTADLYRSWQQWANQRGETVGTQKRLVMRLKSRGFERYRTMTERGMEGLALLPETLDL